jgi:hypothetical protein
LSNPIYDYTRTESPLQRFARWLASLTGEGDPNGSLTRFFLALLAGLAAGALAFPLSGRLGLTNRWARLGVSVGAGLSAAAVFYVATEDFDVTFQALGAVGLAVAALAAGLILAGVGRASTPSSRPRAISELAAVLGMSAVEARRRADESAAQRDYRNAIRYRCLAVLLALDEAGMLTFDRTATNREYLFRAPGTLQNELQPLLTRFDAIWYGDDPTDAEEWAGYSSRAAAIEARVAAMPRVKAA